MVLNVIKKLSFSPKLFLCSTSSEFVFMELSSGHLKKLPKRSTVMSALSYYISCIPDMHVYVMLVYQVVG